MTDTTSPLDTARLLVVGTAPWLGTVTETLEARTSASIDTASSATEAIETVRRAPFDCLLTEYTLDGTTGIELTKRLRESEATFPIVLGTTDGSEAIASEAIGTGVADYVAVDEPDDRTIDELIERIERAIRSAERDSTRQERASQFDAVFQDTQTATWILDPDGSLVRVNRTARQMIDAETDSLIEESFWTLPWWSEMDVIQNDVRQLVSRAREGTFTSAVITRPSSTTRSVMDLSVRPVEDEHGEIVSIVVEGLDITEQVTLERELRQSEELHRVTLNNMTDTVLITDEGGEYTYVCPNVHFIFGYTAEEIYENGTIDALLGDDLFDREELAENGVLKNIECTVADKAGREHTLLVNVREVSIQDGTLLYSCRDITKRKQREEALATLQETAREFLYAETDREIARHIVEDVPTVLDLTASAVYLFDADENALEPVAHSQSITELNGPLPTVHADGKTLPSYSFVNDETLRFEDVHTSELLDNPATDLRSAIYIPLGNHGVFVAGSADVGVFDEITRELADLLAATAEAAFDRVARESQLRAQDRELQQRNEELATLNRINTTIREIDQAIVRAETREEITHTVCARLTDNDRFKFAWIGSVDSTTDTVEPLAWAGDEQGYLGARSIAVGAEDTEPAGQTAASGEVTTVADVAANLRDDPWRSDAITRDFLSIASIPLVYNGFTHGILTVYADTRNAFDGTTRAVLTELGGTIAAALSAIERKHALLTTSMTRIELAIDDPTFPLSQLARTAGCTVTYQGGVQHTTDGDLVFVSVSDADVSAVTEAASGLSAIDEVIRIRAEGTNEGVLQLRLARPFLALELADHGAIFRKAVADPTGTTLVIDIPDPIDSRSIVELVGRAFSTVELERKETLETPTEHDLYARFLEKLTDRQLEILQTAYYSGYFESPRDHSGEAIAETLGISPPAFYQHIRTVQRKLFTTLFEGNTPTVTKGVE